MPRATGTSTLVAMTQTLVIGGGIAGQAVCEELRDRAPDAGITLVCAEPRLPYDRVNLGQLLAGSTVDDLQLRPDDWYADRRIGVRTGKAVARLDPGAGTATLEGGETLAFERAVLCTGSGALVPPIPGIRAEGVHVFRGPKDCAALLNAAPTARSVAVIGGGLLGLEAAYGMAGLGCRVTVVHLMDRLMERQLDGPAAELLAPAIEDLGVEVLLAHNTEEVLTDAQDHVCGLRFAGGTQLDCDLLVVAIGIRAE